MTFAERLADPGWRLTALLFLGMILSMAALRLSESARLRRKFSRARVVRTSFLVSTWMRVCSCSMVLRAFPIFPISVFIPVAWTSAIPNPCTTRVPE